MAEQEAYSDGFDPIRCFTCRGTGFCERCNGHGRYFFRGMYALVDCLLCAGSGNCAECDGTGRVEPDEQGGWRPFGIE